MGLQAKCRNLAPIWICAALILHCQAHGDEQAAGQGPVCRPEDHGAVADGDTYDTAAIQHAFDECGQSNGTVHFAKGKAYLTGTVVMTGTVHAVLPYGAALLGGNRREDFPTNFWDWYIVYMRNCTGCSFTGQGQVNGQANKLWVTGMRNPWEKEVVNFKDPTCWNPIECRPRLFGVRYSQQVLLEGIKLWDPIYWNLHIIQSDQVEVRGLTIWGDPAVPNNDGMDIDSSSNILVTHTNVSALDDAICIKTDDGKRPMVNLTVEHSHARSWGTGLKLGTESRGSFRGIVFRNCTVDAPSHRGISLQVLYGIKGLPA